MLAVQSTIVGRANQTISYRISAGWWVAPCPIFDLWFLFTFAPLASAELAPTCFPWIAFRHRTILESPLELRPLCQPSQGAGMYSLIDMEAFHPRRSSSVCREPFMSEIESNLTPGGMVTIGSRSAAGRKFLKSWPIKMSENSRNLRLAGFEPASHALHCTTVH